MHTSDSSPFGLQFLRDPTFQIAAVEHIAFLRRALIDLRDQLLRRPQERREFVERLDEERKSAIRRYFEEHGYGTLPEVFPSMQEEVAFDQETERLKKQIKNTEIEIERYRLAVQVAAGT